MVRNVPCTITLDSFLLSSVVKGTAKPFFKVSAMNALYSSWNFVFFNSFLFKLKAHCSARRRLLGNSASSFLKGNLML